MSKRGRLDRNDWVKIATGAGVAVAGVVLTEGTRYVLATDFGGNTAVVVAVWSILANVVRKLIAKSKPVGDEGGLS